MVIDFTRSTYLPPTKEYRGLGGVQYMGQLLASGPEIKGHEDGVEPCGGEVGLHNLVTVHLHNSHPVPPTHAQIGEGIGQSVYPLLQVLVGESVILKDYRRPVGYYGAGDGQNLGGCS